jgi:hypothetical protein
MANWKAAIKSLLGISAYEMPKPMSNIPLDSKTVEEIRESLGGQLQMLPGTQVRWYQKDLEDAILMADKGDLSKAGRLWKAVNRDGIFAGIQNTRSEGVVNLPKTFRGERAWIESVERGHGETAQEGARSLFDEMLPPAELAKMVRDGDGMGISVGELMPVEGRDFPVLVVYDTEWIRYIWSENRFYFQSVAGLLPITPGDGRWVLHVPGGRVSPWQFGYWAAAGKAFINKQHAESYKSNWEAKLANSARAAISPQGASEEQAQAWFQRVMAWGVNTVFGLKPGYDVKIVESNGRGHDSFEKTIDRSNDEFSVIVAGQVITMKGGPGFSNNEMFERIAANKIKFSAESIAYTINTQILPQFLVRRYGPDALERGSLVMAYDISPAKDQNSAAAALTAVGGAIKTLDDALTPHGMGLDAKEICTRFGVPIDSNYEAPEQKPIPVAIGVDTIEKIMTVDEGRINIGAEPKGDDRYIYEVGAEADNDNDEESDDESETEDGDSDVVDIDSGQSDSNESDIESPKEGLAISLVRGGDAVASKFDESKIKRGGDRKHPGRFSSKPGSGKSPAKTKSKPLTKKEKERKAAAKKRESAVKKKASDKKKKEAAKKKAAKEKETAKKKKEVAKKKATAQKKKEAERKKKVAPKKKAPTKKAQPKSAKAAPKAPDAHDPATHERTYAHLGTAAKQAAYGHAMHERGLDMSPKDAADSIRHLAKTHEFFQQAVDVLDSMPDVKSVREIVAKFPDDHAAYGAVAALAAHATEMKTAGRMKVAVSVDKSNARDKASMQMVRKASTFYATFASKDHTFNNLHVEFDPDNTRASYNPARNSVKHSGSSQANPAVLEHEFGHGIEDQNKDVKLAVAEFLSKRTANDKVEPIKTKKRKDAFYADGEMCKPDKFVSRYMGKIYEDGGTELMSMGCEYLAREPHTLLAQDPEMFHFILGTLRGKR